MRQAARPGVREEKAGAALVIIPSVRHCSDRREAGSDRASNPSLSIFPEWDGLCNFLLPPRPETVHGGRISVRRGGA